MRGPQTPSHETERLRALWALGILDTAPEERFDVITRLAKTMFDVPIALVSIVDDDRQWFKSRQGLDATETSREISFCGHAILGRDILEVRDASASPDFADNPLVVGDPMIRFYAGCPIRTSTGHPIGTLCLIDQVPRSLTTAESSALRDLADLVERELRSSHLAMIDGLTGLINRWGFEAMAPKLIELARRQGVPASLVFLDLDGFKQINDEFGHRAGDHALQEFATILTTVFRESDLVARLGGDEFTALLSNAGTPETALARLSTALEHRNDQPGQAFMLRASIGWSDVDSERSLAELLCRADTAMYEAKRARVSSAVDQLTLTRGPAS